MESLSVTTEQLVNGAAVPKMTIRQDEESFQLLIDTVNEWKLKRWTKGIDIVTENNKKAYTNYHLVSMIQITVMADATVFIPSGSKIMAQCRDFFIQLGFCQYYAQANTFYLMIELPKAFMTRYLKELTESIVTCVLFRQSQFGQTVFVKAVKTNNQSLMSVFKAFTNGNIKFMHLNLLDSIFKVEKDTIESSNSLFVMQKQFKDSFARHFQMVCMHNGVYQNYTTDSLQYVLSLSQNDRRQYLRWTQPGVILSNLQEQVFQITITELKDSSSVQVADGTTDQSQQFKDFHASLANIYTKTTVLREVLSADLKQLFYRTLYQDPSSANKFVIVHPHTLSVFVGISDDYLSALPLVIDLLPYHGDYILQLLLVAQWFAKVVLSKEQQVDNNQAALLFYGTAGAGKSKIVKALFDALNGYNWHRGEFQSPDLVEKSLLSFEELCLENMATSQYKNVFDFNGSERINIKSKDPVDATMNMPVVTSTNQNPYDKFRELTGCRASQTKQEEILGGFRRLFPVPFMFSIKSRYMDIPALDEVWSSLHRQFLAVNNYQLFNTVFALALCNTTYDQCGVDLPPSLNRYAELVLRAFRQTHFGSLYASRKSDIGDIVDQFSGRISDFKGQGSMDVSNAFMLSIANVESMVDHYALQSVWRSNNQNFMTVYSSQKVRVLRLIRLCSMQSPNAVELVDQQALVSTRFTAWLQKQDPMGFVIQFVDDDLIDYSSSKEQDDQFLKDNHVTPIKTIKDNGVLPSFDLPVVLPQHQGIFEALMPCMPHTTKEHFLFSSLGKRDRTYSFVSAKQLDFDQDIGGLLGQEINADLEFEKSVEKRRRANEN